MGWQGRTRVPWVDTPPLKPGQGITCILPLRAAVKRKNENRLEARVRACPLCPGGSSVAWLPTLCTGVQANWMLGESFGRRFEVGDHKEDSEQGVRTGKDQVRRVHTPLHDQSNDGNRIGGFFED